jgi:hypothetical protein
MLEADAKRLLHPLLRHHVIRPTPAAPGRDVDGSGIPADEIKILKGPEQGKVTDSNNRKI